LLITAIIPTYNEAENLPILVSYLLSSPLQELRIVVVDDKSPDETGRVAESLAATHPGRIEVIHRPRKMGFGTACVSGFRLALESGAEAILQMDADLSHSPDELSKMYAALESCDVVIGSRYVAGGRLDERWPLWRSGLSAFGNAYARTILGLPLRDVTSGFRLWRREALQSLPLEHVKSNGYVFLVETAYLAHRLGYRFSEVPIYFAERQFGQSKMNLNLQLEAAFRVWQVLWSHRKVRRQGTEVRSQE
jgi:dolichol-phosphate mannosyltransferase